MNVMSYFNKEIHIDGCNLSILWPPLKNRVAKNFTTAIFGHPVSKSWLLPCHPDCLLYRQFPEIH